MPAPHVNRLSAEVREADQKALGAIRRLSDYQALNPKATIESLNAIAQNLMAAQERKTKADDEAMAARDALHIAEQELHDALLIAKDQVFALYGPDSDAIQSLGLKKKYKRRRGGNRTQPAPSDG